MNQEERREFLIRELQKERGEHVASLPKSVIEQKILLRGLLNVRPSTPASKEFLEVQDDYLKEEIARKGVFDPSNLAPARGKLCLWQGDITLLKCDAIVNAANGGLTGCWIPNHICIDNCIQTFAGVQMRIECERIIKKQGHTEPFGRCKITPGYNLPCKYVLHTVGPIIKDRPTERDCATLESCYESCLLAANELSLTTLAFCCISTGQFSFPNTEAAKIAISTCEKWLNSHNTSIEKVIFNVFLDKDREIYSRLLGINN